MKKPQIGRKGFEIQFNWIFVLIAGAAILLFFAIAVIKQKEISESLRQASILKGIEAITASASVAIDTTSVIEIPDSEIKIDCASISSGKIAKQYQNLVIFAPSSINGNKIVMQTLAFKAPYKSSGLLFVTSDKLRYVIVGDNELAKEINRTLPQSLDKEIVKIYPSSMRSPNTYKVRLVIADSTNLQSASLPNSLKDMKDGDVTALKVTGNLEAGSIEFYEKRGATWILNPSSQSQYIGKASLIAAVYADTKELYECSMKNAFLRHKLVTQVHIDRLKYLKDNVASTDCSGIYTSALGNLNNILTASSGLAAGIEQAKRDSLLAASQELSDKNKEAQKFSCPLVY